MSTEGRLQTAIDDAMTNAWIVENVIGDAIKKLRGLPDEGTYIAPVGNVSDIVAALRDMIPYRDQAIVEMVTERFWDAERERDERDAADAAEMRRDVA